MTDTDERAKFDAWWTGEYGWHSIRAEWADTPTDAAWMAWRAQAEEIKRLKAALNADPQTLRLHLGEMTAQEMRTLKAGLQWVLNRAALAQGGEK